VIREDTVKPRPISSIRVISFVKNYNEKRKIIVKYLKLNYEEFTELIRTLPGGLLSSNI